MREREKFALALILSVAEPRVDQATFTIQLDICHTRTSASTRYLFATMGTHSSHVKRPDYILVGI
jgi:hypothetical protein